MKPVRILTDASARLRLSRSRLPLLVKHIARLQSQSRQRHKFTLILHIRWQVHFRPRVHSVLPQAVVLHTTQLQYEHVLCIVMQREPKLLWRRRVEVAVNRALESLRELGCQVCDAFRIAFSMTDKNRVTLR